MGAQTALAGLLRRKPLYDNQDSPILARQLRGLWISLFIGVVMTGAGGIWLMGVNPGYARSGFVHIKIMLSAILFFIALVPIRQANQNLEDNGPPLAQLWFWLSVLGFMALMYLGVFKPM
jgi:hypothetical protein